MAHTRRTLSLEPGAWDLTLDSVGNIAITQGELATAQNVANEARLFTDDAYFIQDQGIPHFVVELGQNGNESVLRSYLRDASLKVEDVQELISVEITDFDTTGRRLSGDIRFETREKTEQQNVTTSF